MNRCLSSSPESGERLLEHEILLERLINTNARHSSPFRARTVTTIEGINVSQIKGITVKLNCEVMVLNDSMR